ncbi:hypothetical protein Ga0074812_13055 [Parafrankia irregularis]|uniref:DUF916 domain-containing protein n=1 Tax=Parafrankia irregularis TaxID=795642 RepID=A0A0S4QVD9_9ACTN|nr:hypothetical protein Ga0074812_13055 [Parafrankia irregularis]
MVTCQIHERRRARTGRVARILVVLGCLLGQLALAGAGPAAAAPSPAAPAPTAPAPAFGLSVSPTRMVVSPEQIDGRHEFTVTNRGRDPLDLAVSHTGFSADHEGNVRFLREETPYSAMSWVKVQPERFRLAPGARQVVTVRITVPPRPEPGDHHVAILFMVPAQGREQIRLNRGIGAPIYITVPGPVDDTVKITRLAMPSFSPGGPIRISATFRNTGTVHRDFRGEKGRLRLRVGGGTVTLPDFTVPRGETRNVSVQWNDPPAMCRCRAELAFPSRDGSMQRAAASVTIFPVVRATVVLVGLVLLGLVGLFGRRFYRRRVTAAAQVLRRQEDAESAIAAGKSAMPDTTDGR